MQNSLYDLMKVNVLGLESQMESCVNKTYDKFESDFCKVIDEHTPLKQRYRKKMNYLT